MAASGPRQAGLLDLPAELARQVWQGIDTSTSCHNVMATSKGVQALMAPAVDSLEFTLQPQLNQQPFRGLHPNIQPQRTTIKAAVGEEPEEMDYGSYDKSGCHASFGLFVLAFVSSPHFGRLEEVHIQVCICVPGVLHLV
jgi:hypothetical protein